MLPCQHCIRVHFSLQAKRCFHISHYTRLHRSAHWRTHTTLVAERVAAHELHGSRRHLLVPSSGSIQVMKPLFICWWRHGILCNFLNVILARCFENHAETCIGEYIYYGDAAIIHAWEFRTRLYIAGKNGDHCIEAMSKVCDGLRGDAFIAAQEAGFDNLREIIDGRLCGIEALISHMREAIFPSTEYEPERLFCQPCPFRMTLIQEEWERKVCLAATT